MLPGRMKSVLIVLFQQRFRVLDDSGGPAVSFISARLSSSSCFFTIQVLMSLLPFAGDCFDQVRTNRTRSFS